MTSFEIVAIVLTVFLGFGIITGVLIVSVVPRRRAYEYLEDRDPQRPVPPEDDEKPPRWPGG
ncbi:MAG: hypothetical protein ACRDNW_09580 [Trebonia sp.]